MDLENKPIVVGTDGSTRAERAVTKAGELAGLAGTRLHVVTGYAKELVDLVPHDLPARARDRLIAEVEATSNGMMRRKTQEWAARGVDVEYHMERGDPVSVLHKVARTIDAGLIVVGNRGIDRGLGLVGRSLPHRVSRHAPCDVLVVDTAA